MMTTRDPVADGLAALASALGVYGDTDTVGQEKAREAIIAGRAAYWGMAKYHDARACDLPYYLNTGIPPVDVIEAAYAKRPESKLHGLDTLIPLNGSAVADLKAAYVHYGREVRVTELEARRTADPRRKQ